MTTGWVRAMGKGISVLQVAASEGDAESVLRPLRDAGYTVRAKRADDPVALGCALAEEAWDVIAVCDGVPGCDVHTALAAARHTVPGIPVIVISAGVGDEAAAALIKAGAADFLLWSNLVRLPAAIDLARRTGGVRPDDLKPAMEAAGAGSFDWDIRTGHLRWSEEMQALYGYLPGEFDGTFAAWAGCLLPEDRGTVLQAAIGAAQRGVACQPFCIRRQDTGEERWMEIRGQTLRDGRGEAVRMVGINLDVTSRVLAEAVHRRDEALVRGICDVTPDCIYLKDREGRLLFANPAALRATGMPPQELPGQTASAYFPSLGAGQSMLAADLRVMDRGETEVMEVRVQTTAGLRDFLTTKTPWRDERGRVAGLVGVSRDVTEWKHADQTAVAWQRAFEKAEIGITLANPDDETLEMVNEAFARMLGYTREEMVGFPIVLLHPPEIRAEFPLQMASAIEAGHAVFETVHMRKDGTRFPVSVDLTLGRDASGRVVSRTAFVQDLTGRHEVEAARRTSEERLKLALTAARMGVWELDLRTHTVTSSPECNLLFGVDRIGGTIDSLRALIHPADRSRVIETALQALAERTPSLALEFRIRRPDGKVLWVSDLAVARYAADGEPTLLFGLVRDITGQKEADRALQASEERFRSLVETGYVWVWEVDRNGVYTYSSPQVRMLLGYAPEEVLGRPVYDLMPPEEAERIRAVYDGMVASPEPASGVESLHRHRDGRLVVLETSGAPIRSADGEFVGFRGMARDITDRKRAEDALHASEQRYRDVCLSIGDVIYELDAESRVTHISDRVVDLLGYSPEEVLGTIPFWGQADGTREALRLRMRELFGGRASFRDEEAWATTKDGRPVCLQFSGAPNFDAGGAWLGYRGTIRDVTAYKKEQQERDSLAGQLQQAQKLESIGRLAGGVAHDFNNLLTIINGYADLAAEDVSPDDPLHLALDEIRQAGGRAAELTQQLLAFSRKQVISPKPVNLNDFVGQNQNMLQRLIGEDIEFTSHLDPLPGVAMADPGQLHQVLMNLVVNARDAMPEGGRLTIATANVDLDEDAAAQFAGARPGAYVTLSVSDSGCGMDAEVRQRIFDPFFTTKGEGRGTGLGLATVYGIVSQSGGWIGLESAPGAGSTFTMGLPRLESEVTSEVPAVEQHTNLRGSGTILLVEDQADVRRFTAKVLLSYGYRVLEAETGGDALLIAERHGAAIDLMLTDVVMPRMTGKELADRLRPLRPNMPVLFMSGYAEDAIARHGILDEGVNHIAKPFAPEELALKIRDVLAVPPPPGKVLVADDDEAVRRLFDRVLTAEGYEVALAADGREALEMLESGIFSLIITDLVMPGREGIETIRTIRDAGIAVKIVAVSGAFGGSFLRVAEMLGADAVLKKPVSPQDLLATVRRVLTAV
jgi:two-component system, cell cycle sensor histidine kinase and response regulator CckA